MLLFTSVTPFLLTLQSPLLFDAYSHVVNASQQTWRQVAQSFYEHPRGGDFFFRPLGYMDYWVEAHGHGPSFHAWHASGILFHLLATMLAFSFCRGEKLSATASTLAALVFGLHGSNPEVVSWTAARFDELATCFTLACLILLIRYLDTGKSYGAMLLSCCCALLSKESAFCLPGIAFCAVRYRGSVNARGRNALLGLAFTATVVLVYRFWVLGGVGGYSDVTGMPTALHVSLLHLAELLFFRMWPVLLLPINWSLPCEWWLTTAIVLLSVGCCLITLRGCPDTRRFGLVSASVPWRFCLPVI